VPFMNQALFVGPLVDRLGGADVAYVIGFIVAGILYWVLEEYAGSSAISLD
jgi:NCS1 family nucleobase:cation symporter-1